MDFPQARIDQVAAAAVIVCVTTYTVFTYPYELIHVNANARMLLYIWRTDQASTLALLDINDLENRRPTVIRHRFCTGVRNNAARRSRLTLDWICTHAATSRTRDMPWNSAWTTPMMSSLKFAPCVLLWRHANASWLSEWQDTLRTFQMD